MEMGEKIVCLLETARESDEVLPIQQDSILNRLAVIAPDVADEYVKGITGYIERVLIWRSIITSIGRPHLSRFLIESLEKKQIEDLNEIVLYLSSKEPIDDIEKLIELTFNIKTPTQESRKKAAEFVEVVRSIDYDRTAAAWKFGSLAKRASLIADAFILEGTEYEKVLHDRLSVVDPGELDEMLEMMNSCRRQ